MSILQQGVTPIQDQLRLRALVKQNEVDEELVRRSMFLLESSSNEVFIYFVPIVAPILGPDAYMGAMPTEVACFISEIYKLGARRIVVFSLGPVGCVPARAPLLGAPVGRCLREDECDVQEVQPWFGELGQGRAY
ncbi:hypothetical protein ACJRO7_028298 [Eucalyptus globulus]|uniref:Uncharacterized protein n=1 Tax=Eucalyptus globulus TaxID=34317 RepID=A0ABD3K407_EUCGL